eukprot:g4101.t1
MSMEVIDTNNRGLQTTCTAEEGFTLTSQTFPEMEGCFEAQEVIPTGRPGLDIMEYRSETALFWAVLDPYFGFSWYASYYVGELDNYGVGESMVTVCRTNEEIGDNQPADESLTYACDLDGDGVRETSPATATTLSFRCGCDGEPSPPPSPTTPTPSATPDSIDSTSLPLATTAAPTTPITPSPSAAPGSIDGTGPPAAAPSTSSSAPLGATIAPSTSGKVPVSVAPTTTAGTAAPTAAPSGSPTSVVATTAPALLDDAATGSAGTNSGASWTRADGALTLAAMIGGVSAVVAAGGTLI